jgi:mRNA-degrading endonuclease toxin of MazEF toxin-antitoxin module
VINVSQTSAIGREKLVEHHGHVDDATMELVDGGLRQVLNL